MGTWGEGAFDNDAAADWSWEFENADLATGLRLITDALSAIAQADTAYLDDRDGVLAVAAAELVTSINGQPIDATPYNETARQWIARVRPSPDPDLTNLARLAVSRVTSQTSGLAELWDEAGSAEWRSVMGALRDKLST